MAVSYMILLIICLNVKEVLNLKMDSKPCDKKRHGADIAIIIIAVTSLCNRTVLTVSGSG